MARLRAEVVAAGGKPSLLDGWVSTKRISTNNDIHWYYDSPSGERFRSIVQLLGHCGLAPAEGCGKRLRAPAIVSSNDPALFSNRNRVDCARTCNAGTADDSAATTPAAFHTRASGKDIHGGKHSVMANAPAATIEKLEDVLTWVACDRCHKWRRVADASQLPSTWFCELNPDAEYASCDVPEEEPDQEGASDGEEEGETEGEWEAEGAMCVVAPITEVNGLKLHLLATNPTGYRGVHLHRGKFIVRTAHHGVRDPCKSFDSALEAAVAYAQRMLELGAPHTVVDESPEVTFDGMQRLERLRDSLNAAGGDPASLDGWRAIGTWETSTRGNTSLRFSFCSPDGSAQFSSMRDVLRHFGLSSDMLVRKQDVRYQSTSEGVSVNALVVIEARLSVRDGYVGLTICNGRAAQTSGYIAGSPQLRPACSCNVYILRPMLAGPRVGVDSVAWKERMDQLKTAVENAGGVPSLLDGWGAIRPLNDRRASVSRSNQRWQYTDGRGNQFNSISQALKHLGLATLPGVQSLAAAGASQFARKRRETPYVIVQLETSSTVSGVAVTSGLSVVASYGAARQLRMLLDSSSWSRARGRRAASQQQQQLSPPQHNHQQQQVDSDRRDHSRGESPPPAKQQRLSQGRASNSQRAGNSSDEDTWVACDRCHKWRRVADASKLPSKWFCELNTDMARASCDDPEEEWQHYEWQEGDAARAAPPRRGKQSQDFLQCGDGMEGPRVGTRYQADLPRVHVPSLQRPEGPAPHQALGHQPAADSSASECSARPSCECGQPAVWQRGRWFCAREDADGGRCKKARARLARSGVNGTKLRRSVGEGGGRRVDTVL